MFETDTETNGEFSPSPALISYVFWCVASPLIITDEMVQYDLKSWGLSESVVNQIQEAEKEEILLKNGRKL